jgi:integrase
MVKAATRQRGRAICVRELFLNPNLLAAAACDSARLDGRGDEELTDATLQNRRIAARNFMRLMEDLLGSDADPLIAEFEAAVRARWELVGMTYLSTSGRPTGRKTFTPTQSDVDALMRELASSPKAYFAERNVAFFSLLASTGMRLSSAIKIGGSDFHRLGSTLWVSVPEKSKTEPSPVRITPELEATLECYVSALNRYGSQQRSSQRIGFGVPGAFWRCPPNRPWTTQAAAKVICRASRRACTQEFGPQALRRYATQQLLKVMPRATVADVLRWDGLGTPDEHYGPPPGSTLPEHKVSPPGQAGKECRHVRA